MADFSNHQRFSLRCLNQDLIPVSIRLRSTIKTPKGQQVIKKVERRKLKTILKKHKITANEQLITCKEDLKQALQAKAQGLRRYTKRSEQYKQNKMFREDSKRFYRELGKKTIQIEKPPDIGEVKKFWQNILEQEVKHNEDAQ